MMKTKYKPQDFSDLSPEKILEKVYGKPLDELSPPFNPNWIASQMSLDVDDKTINFDDMGEDIEGKAFVENKKPKVWINRFLSGNRKDFTLAHEIGHVVWDILPALENIGLADTFKDHGGTLSFNRDGVGGIREYCANDFAGRLLMPQVVLRRELKEMFKEKNTRDASVIIPAMAKLFQVSEQAMIVRLKRLKILKSNY